MRIEGCSAAGGGCAAEDADAAGTMITCGIGGFLFLEKKAKHEAYIYMSETKYKPSASGQFGLNRPPELGRVSRACCRLTRPPTISEDLRPRRRHRPNHLGPGPVV